MTRTPLIWIGLAGIAPDDNARAQDWQHRLDAVMIAIALLALPAYVLEVATTEPTLQHLAHALDVAIFVAFLLETLWMLHVTSKPVRYLVENWLNVLIVIAAGTSVVGAPTEWIALIRTARVAVSSLLLIRAVAEVDILFTRKGAPLLVGTAALVMLSGGAMFYWLEPTIHNYWDGLWLAFVTGATIGYGDYVPTSGAARMFAVFMAIAGVTLITLFTANVVAFFLGAREDTARELIGVIEQMRRDLAELRREPGPAQEGEMRGEIDALRAEIAAAACGARGDTGRSRATPPRHARRLIRIGSTPGSLRPTPRHAQRTCALRCRFRRRRRRAGAG